MSVSPAGVVLAGGASSRMGRDKALIEVGGRPMAARVAEALVAGGCTPVWCQGGNAAGLAEIGLATRPDRDGRVGPVGAIAAVLADVDAAAVSDGVVVAACDLPSLTPEVVRALVEQRDLTGSVAVAVSGGRRHLIAAWPPGTSLAVGRLVAEGVASYGELLRRLGAVGVAVDDDVVRNVNRPDDLR